MKRKIFAIFAVVTAIGCSTEEVSNAVQGQHVEAELISETKTIQPGQPFWVGLRLEMEENWHINWINPGDAGLAPKISWELPDGFSAGEIEWPYPIRIPISPFMLFGYEDNLVLPIKITPPEKLKSGSDVKLTANTEWVICNDACIPGSATLNLELEAKNEEPQLNEKWVPSFAAAKLKLPVNNEEWFFNAEISPYRVYIKMTPIGDTDAEFSKMFFYPEQQGIVNNAADQKLTKKGNGYELEIERDRMGKNIPEELLGVLVVDVKLAEGKERKGIKLNLPLKRIES